MDTINQLEKFGLSKKEASAYVALLRLQQASPYQISKESGLERTTIYKIIEQLSKQGLATKAIHGKRITYIAEVPANLKQILNQKRDILEQILPVLTALQGKKQEKPNVRFYEDLIGVRKALTETLECEEKLRRDFASVESIVEFLGRRFINRHIEERVRRRIRVRSLRSRPTGSKISEKEWYLKKETKELLREVRYLIEEISFEPVIFIYDNTVTIISSKKESYALIIESRELSQAMKILFDIAWKQAGR